MSFIAVAIGGSAITGLVGGILGSKAATKAANTQANSADYAATLQKQAADDALAFQKQQFGYQQNIQAPWLRTGASSVYTLARLMGLPVGQVMQMTGNTGNVGTGTTNPGTGVVNTGGTTGTGLDANGNPLTQGGEVDQNIQDNGTGDPGTQPGTGTGTNTSGTIDPNNPLSGVGANTNLPEGYLTKGWTENFNAPTDVTEQNDPGYQFRLNQGMKALQASAAAKGNLFTGGTGKQMQRYGQDYASNEYSNVYSRALGQYQDRYNIFKQNQSDLFNRYAALSGMGQVSAGQLNSAGTNAANNTSSILLNSASNIGQQANNAAAARASGYVGSTNALMGGLNSGASSIANLLLMRQLLGGTGGTPPFVDPSICWVAAELYGGWTDKRTTAVRTWLLSNDSGFVAAYRKRGPEWAAQVRTDPAFRSGMKLLFDSFLARAA